MIDSLVQLYENIRHIHLKRKNIQRHNIFSEPVFGYSLERIVNSDTLDRKDTYTDTTKYINEIPVIDDWVINELHKSGYYRLSDIALVDEKIICTETKLPDNAVSELSEIATSDYNVPYLEDGNVVESCNRKNVINSLIKSEWSVFILLEYSLLSYLQNKTKEIYMTSECDTKNDLILLFKDYLDNPREHIEAIAFCTNSSEKYVRDVLSGRIKYSLTNKEKENILERDNHQCRICSCNENLEIHHVIPVANGGGKYDKNLCTLCSDCHFNIAHGKNTSNISYDSQNEFWEDIIGEEP